MGRGFEGIFNGDRKRADLNRPPAVAHLTNTQIEDWDTAERLRVRVIPADTASSVGRALTQAEIDFSRHQEVADEVVNERQTSADQINRGMDFADQMAEEVAEYRAANPED